MEQNTEKDYVQAYLKVAETLEEDDDFDEFEVDDWEDENAALDDTRRWKNNWEDEDVDDDFIAQLRKEIQAPH